MKTIPQHCRLLLILPAVAIVAIAMTALVAGTGIASAHGPSREGDHGNDHGNGHISLCNWLPGTSSASSSECPHQHQHPASCDSRWNNSNCAHSTPGMNCSDWNADCVSPTPATPPCDDTNGDNPDDCVTPTVTQTTISCDDTNGDNPDDCTPTAMQTAVSCDDTNGDNPDDCTPTATATNTPAVSPTATETATATATGTSMTSPTATETAVATATNTTVAVATATATATTAPGVSAVSTATPTSAATAASTATSVVVSGITTPTATMTNKVAGISAVPPPVRPATGAVAGASTAPRAFPSTGTGRGNDPTHRLLWLSLLAATLSASIGGWLLMRTKVVR